MALTAAVTIGAEPIAAGANGVCFGHGAGGFPNCSDLGQRGAWSGDVALGDAAPSLIYASGFESNESPKGAFAA